jgi:hypothetical protein
LLLAADLFRLQEIESFVVVVVVVVRRLAVQLILLLAGSDPVACLLSVLLKGVNDGNGDLKIPPFAPVY